MKVLVINSSHRRNGTIGRMLEGITKHFSSDVELELAHLHDYEIRPCIGCMKCRSTNKCCLPADGAHLLAGKIQSADAIIVGSPVYWGNISGNLKVLFDRIVPILMAEDKYGRPVPLQKGKKAAFVTSCTTPWPFNFIFAETRGAKRAIKEIFHFSGYKTVGILSRPGTKKNQDLSDRFLAKAKTIARRIEK